MRIIADLELCQGHAMCELEAPDVFAVPKRGKVKILNATPPADLHADVENAVGFCPTQALAIVEDTVSTNSKDV
jgi:ferredoxin